MDNETNEAGTNEAVETSWFDDTKNFLYRNRWKIVGGVVFAVGIVGLVFAGRAYARRGQETDSDSGNKKRAGSHGNTDYSSSRPAPNAESSSRPTHSSTNSRGGQSARAGKSSATHWIDGVDPDNAHLKNLTDISLPLQVRHGYADRDGFWTDKGYERATTVDMDRLEKGTRSMEQRRAQMLDPDD